MAYNQQTLNKYRALHSAAPAEAPAHVSSSPSSSAAYTPSAFRSRTCPYCNGLKDPTVKHINPDTKPDSPWDFWQHVVIDKYKHFQSPCGRENMARAVGGEKDKMFVVGPMVDQSELPFRLLCRQYGATLTYTPMLHAKLFRDGQPYRRHFLTTTPCARVAAALASRDSDTRGTDVPQESVRDDIKVAGESPNMAIPDLFDRPVFVQFCGHDADVVLEAARLALYEEDETTTTTTAMAEPKQAVVGITEHTQGAGASHESSRGASPSTPLYRCDAVDLNLGCPQGIAKRGHYGSFLMEDWETIHTIIHTLHVELEVPVTAKIRVFDLPSPDTTAHGGRGNDVDGDDVAYDEALTIEYARMVRDAGAQVVCVHGRTRAMKGQHSGLANMALIGRVHDALEGSVPVIANGNVLDFDDVQRHLEATRCEGHMCAEPLLWEPRLFARVDDAVRNGRLFGADKKARLAAINTALEYLCWVRRYPVDLGFVKTHLFKMCHHSYELHVGFRDCLGRWGTSAGEESTVSNGVTTASTDTNTRTREGTADGDGSVEAQLDALESHLHALMKAELQCDVEGEQPKSAHAEKQKARESIKDVLEEDDGDVGFGLLF